MRTTCAGLLSVSTAVIAGFMASGCAPRLRAIPGPSQGPVDDGRGVFEYSDNLNVTAVSMSHPPVGTGNEFVAFAVQVRNTSQSTFVIDVNQIRLGLGVGPEWMEKGPVPPDDLVRAYQSARASDSVREVTGPELVHWGARRGVHVYRYYGYRGYPYYAYPYYGYPYYYGYYGYPYYYDSGRDIYLQRQATAAFLARLLRSQEIPPDHVIEGFVVFSQELDKRDQFRLTVPLAPVAPPPTATRPAPAPAAVAQVFEFHFVAR